MIHRREIMDFSRELGLRPDIVDKDYVLGWFLAGIAQHPDLNSNWIFKGGTCLKKCFSETYRFSEDLDFTIMDPDQLNSKFLTKAFTEISGWIYETVGIEIPRESIRFDVYQNPHGGTSVQGRISFRGPMQRERNLTRVRLDLTADEVLVLDPVMRIVHHPYTDNPTEGIEVRCYCFEEVFAEKIRALKERLRPRDLYDVVHLYRHNNIWADRQVVMETLRDKCEFKGLTVPTERDFIDHPGQEELQAEWGNMLGHQLPALPPFEQLWNELGAVFTWLEGRDKKVERPAFPVSVVGIDTAWRPPAMIQSWGSSVPLEIIRFAAANRLCVNLVYAGSSSLIEPYSLRRTSDGHLLLHATRHNTGEDRSYRVDRIQGAEATTEPFTPRYTIEFTVSGLLSAPPTRRTATGTS